jgi:hypothetical protein
MAMVHISVHQMGWMENLYRLVKLLVSKLVTSILQTMQNRKLNSTTMMKL